MSGDANIKQQAETIFDDVFGKGHGKEMTITRFVSVFNLTKEEAVTLFDSIYTASYTYWRS